jgi:sialate O-acetylesterase
MLRVPLRLLVCLASALLARADVTLAPLFHDHAVLQCDQPVPVWGQAEPGEAVTVAFGGQNLRTIAGVDGRWLVRLAPLPASSHPAELVVTGKNTVRATDVLVGEVWLCSGQSNMEFPVNDPKIAYFKLDNAAAEVAAADYPLIRQFKVARAVAAAPAASVRGDWAVCSPETVGQFTAAGYFFARDLHRKLGVPVGIINSTWGGTPVESWMSAQALAAPEFHAVAARWQQMLAEFPSKKTEADAAIAAWNRAEAAAKANGPAAHAIFLQQNRRPRLPRGPGDPWTPSGLFNGMIAPLVPAAFRGVLWYQGESNAERASEYRALFGTMITQWRETWARGNFPFYFVQLANYRLPSDPSGATYAFLREAQAQTLALPNTGMAVTIDIGNPDDIHPGNKQEVGHRLALIAETNTYGCAGEASGPVVASVSRDGAALRVKFTHAEGLATRHASSTGFALAGADKVFHPADVRVEGDSVVVSSSAVPAPVAVRYAWANAPSATLFNSAGLPASPFRTDKW